MWAVLASGLLAGGGAILTGSFMLQRIISNLTEEELVDAENRFTLIDNIMYRVESETRKRGRAALAALAQSYPSLDAALASNSDRLKLHAGSLGVDDVYFLDRSGVIRASSMQAETGFSLYSLGDEYRSFLEGLLASGRFADQRVTMAFNTAKVTSYQYYGPPGADYIIEVSSRMEDALARTFPRYTFKSLLRLLLNLDRDPDKVHLVSAVDLVTGDTGQYRSYIDGRIIDRRLAALVDLALARDGYARERTGSRTTTVKSMPFSHLDFDFVDTKTLAVFEADTSLVLTFGLLSMAVSLTIVVAAIMATYFLSVESFRKNVALRLESLSKAMKRVGTTGSAEPLDDGLDDEISAIAQTAGAMVAEIRQRNSELSELARCLEEEVEAGVSREKALAEALEANQALVHEMDHRVKNNLQLAMSLAAMQARSQPSQEVSRELERMRTRLGTLSMVQDHALIEPDRPRVDMQRLLSTIRADIASTSGRPAQAVLVDIDASGMELEPDIAMAVGLIAAEFIDNAYRHAFCGMESGRLSVSLKPLGPDPETGLWELAVSDNGPGSPESGGVGLELAEALSTQLGGSLSWESSSGTRIRATLRPRRQAD